MIQGLPEENRTGGQTKDDAAGAARLSRVRLAWKKSGLLVYRLERPIVFRNVGVSWGGTPPEWRSGSKTLESVWIELLVVLGPHRKGAFLSRRDEVPAEDPGRLHERITRLFEQLRMPLYRYLLVALGNGEEAEELAQECFLRLCRHLRNSAEITDERLWIFHVAHNLVLDRKKSGRERYEVLPADWMELTAARAASEPNPEQVLLENDRNRRLRNAFLELTAQQREVMRLREEGLGYREIAEALSLNVPAVAAHIRRAVAKIKASLNDQERP